MGDRVYGNMKKIIILYLCVGVAAFITSCTSEHNVIEHTNHKPETSGAAKYSEHNYARQILEETNKIRAKHGRKSLKSNKQLIEIARTHSVYMSNKAKQTSSISEILSHSNFDSRFKRAQNEVNIGALSENVAYMYTSSDAAVRTIQKWYASKGHNKNMMDRYYTTCGVSVVKKGERLFITMLMGEEKGHKPETLNIITF